MIFGCQCSIINTSVDIHIDIQAGISIEGYSAMDIRKRQIFMNRNPCFYGYKFSIILAFMDIHLDIHRFLWITMYMDLLWILDPGINAIAITHPKNSRI